ncbi:MAG: response regulator transcription factor [Pedosphaera sp.]|nr:response regulator transcription factor [Pedosphaera sp.]
MKPKILVVDDEPDAVELIEFNLKAAGFDVSTASDGAEALTKARLTQPDLIVLDLMLPEVDGLEVCKILRREPVTSAIPVLMLTAKAAEIDRVLGFELGADDYVTKPFSPRELVLRVKRLLHRRKSTEELRNVFMVGELSIDIPRHHATVKGRKLDLTAIEFKLLAMLAQRRGRVQSRDQLLRDVWGYDNVIDTRTVDTHMRRLREKLGRASRYLDTVRGVGYRFLDE